MAVTKAPEFGGYDNDFVSEVPDKFVCTICTKVLRDPRLTECCGQHFCESCLTHWFGKRKTKTCPHCRDKNFVHIQNKALKRDISQLKIHCTLSRAGCTWQGELGDLQAHLKSDTGCDFVMVECPYQCKVRLKHLGHELIVVNTLKRKDIAQHLSSECYLRRYKCEHCNLEDTYEAITGKSAPIVRRKKCSLPSYDPYPYSSHYKECPMIPLDCPNQCGAKSVKRRDMHSHQDQCPMEKLECPYQCKQRNRDGGIVKCYIYRRDLRKHLRTQCYLRRYTCEYCGYEDTYQAITGGGGLLPIFNYHFETCSNFPVECLNECGAVDIKRKDMPTHREQCPLEPVQCPFQEAGCQTGLVRRDLDNHMATQTQQHLLLTFQTMHKKNSELMKQGDDLRKDNAQLAAQCYDLRMENTDLRKQCINLNKELANVKQELQMVKRKKK